MPGLRSQVDHFNTSESLSSEKDVPASVGELTSDRRDRNLGKGSLPCGLISTTSASRPLLHQFTGKCIRNCIKVSLVS